MRNKPLCLLWQTTLLCLFVVSCSHSQVKPSEQTPASPSSPSHSPSSASSSVATLPQENSVEEATSTMQSATEEMRETVEMVEQIRAKEQKLLDLSTQRAQKLQALEEFFAGALEQNGKTFWFPTKQGKIGVAAKHGKVEKVAYGLFIFYRQMVVWQKSGAIRTEFYVDSSSNELMVHQFANGRLVKNTNYVLTP